MSDINYSSVLIIDDEIGICIAVKELLEMYNYNAEYSNTAEEGIEYLSNNPRTDVVILDINLGLGMNGLEALQIIKKQYRYIQVIMFTSINTLESGLECMKKGAIDYVTKPFDDLEFLKKVATAIESKKTEQMKDLYQGIIIHDLKNPLQNILGAIEFLRISLQDNITDQQNKFLLSAEKGVNLIRIMINNILSISMFENGTLIAKKDSFHLKNEIEKITESFNNDMILQQKKMETLFDVEDDYFICTDKDCFTRVLINIISNAIRFTPREGYINLFFQTLDNNYLKISVTNSGSFIEKHLRESIFEKFSSISNSNNQLSNQNYGLGLTYCKMAIESMGGKIWVDGNKNIPETTFHFKIRNHRNN
jgi:K+-sensing histidine kinase KdpD